MGKANQDLMMAKARRDGGAITTDVPPATLLEAIDAGTIVIVREAFDPAELRRARAAILAWNAPDTPPDMSGAAKSTRERREDPPGSPIAHVFDSFLFAVHDPADAIGPAVRATFDRLAAYWRALTGGAHGFAPASDGRCLRPRALYYPAGGGYFDWHEHPRDPLHVGVILGASEMGVDFHSGATEFKTPSGVVNTSASHGIGDICLFRYDLSHRVTPVDPARERRWDGAGRWVFTLTVQ
jgi:hypothetical protein